MVFVSLSLSLSILSKSKHFLNWPGRVSLKLRGCNLRYLFSNQHQESQGLTIKRWSSTKKKKKDEGVERKKKENPSLHSDLEYFQLIFDLAPSSSRPSCQYHTSGAERIWFDFFFDKSD